MLGFSFVSWYLCISRETEDELSSIIEAFYRNLKTVDFKEQVRLEVEERLRKEALEKEAKRKAAEDRRAAVVERLRKKAEEEERRRLEAEAALLRIQEEHLRKEQESRDRLESDRRNMQLEDDFSHLAEQDCKERLEKALYLQREKEKLAEWERAQRAKDEEEARHRHARMAVLEEKKAKLAELKRLQEISNTKDGSSAVAASLTVARDEAAKLNKQMRIQNKAKFVTKKIQSGTSADGVSTVVDVNSANLLTNEEVVSASQGLPSGGSSPSAADVGVLAVAVGDSVPTSALTSTIARGWVAAASASIAGANVAGAGAGAATGRNPDHSTSPERDQQFLQQLAAMDSEVAVKALQRDLMAEKRELRLAQKQRLAEQQGGGGGRQDPAEIEYAKGLRAKIEEITFREKAAQQRLEKILAAQKASLGGVGTVTGASVKTLMALSAGTGAGKAAEAETHDTVEAPFSSSSADQSVNQAALLHKAEHVLREGAHILAWLSNKGLNNGSTGSSETGTAGADRLMNKSFAKSFVFIRTDDASMQRRATVLLMEISQLLRDIDQRCDPSNYSEQLAALSASLKYEWSKPTTKTVCVHSPEQTSSATPTSTSIQDSTTEVSDNPKNLHPSDSTSSIPSRGLKGRTALLTSTSNSELQGRNVEIQAELSSLDSESTIRGETRTEPVRNVTKEPERKEEDKLSEGKEGEEEEKEQDEEEDKKEEEMTFEDIAGWEECLTTSMASAAHHAAFYGYAEVLDCLCRYFDCFVMDQKGRTPLFYAALQNQLSCVASLVALDSQWIDVGDQNGDTSLHAAAIANGVEVLSFLLSCEANPDTANYAGLTPCHLARSKAALAALCDAGAQAYCVDSKSRMPLWFACNEGRSDCVEFLCGKTPAQYILWPDDEGETCLHKAAMNGHSGCVEALCQSLQGTEDLYTVNKKQHTAAHVASSPAVLKVLYENGANLWTADPKGRMPLFMASFFGKADCIAFLVDIACSGASNSGTSGGSVSNKATPNNSNDGIAVVGAADKQGDTALHAACLCGHVQCVSLLLYYTRSARNKQGLTPDELAMRAGHQQIALLVQHVEHKRAVEGLDAAQIFGCDFSLLAAVTLYYGSRWAKQYDVSFDTVYYLDRVTGASQWERPEAYDEPAKEEQRGDTARAVLHAFYSKYNAERLGSMNDILFAYRGRYTELFISLANKYNVEDLSMFQGVNLD